MRSSSLPMRPAPITPSVRPVSPIPMLSIRSCQRPVRVSRSLRNRRPASASTNVSAMVATGRGIELGVLVTMTPAARHRRHVDGVVADAVARDDVEPAIGARDRGGRARAAVFTYSAS